MKNVYIVANWKSNKTKIEANNWLHKFQISNFQYPISNKKIILCPSSIFLSDLSQTILEKELPFKLGGQDISPFDEGAFTGEVNGKQIREFAEYVIVGHSERRKNFSEDDNMVIKKLEMAKKYDLVPILCISEINQIDKLKMKWKMDDGKWKIMIAYEPLSAIGSGHADTPENAEKIAENIKNELGDVYVIYGGSITSKNIKSFIEMPNVDGVLVGGASLDPLEFGKIVEVC